MLKVLQILISRIHHMVLLVSSKKGKKWHIRVQISTKPGKLTYLQFYMAPKTIINKK